MKGKFWIVFGMILGLFHQQCASTLYMPMDPDPTRNTQLLNGRRLYINHCGSCHNLYSPQQYPPHTWKENLIEMQERSHITDSERELIYQYLIGRQI